MIGACSKVRSLLAEQRVWGPDNTHKLTRCHCLEKNGSLNSASLFVRVSGRCRDAHTTPGCPSSDA